MAKQTKKQANPKIKREPENEENMLESPFVIGEYLSAVNLFMKNGKAAGLDDIRTEQIKHFGPVTNKWVLDLMNNCIEADQIPKTWRKTRVVALLKPGKDPNKAKNFRPISLLCHLYKVLERMILNRIISKVDEILIPEQAGFRAGKSCTGVAFVDLSAAYDTINHGKLKQKIYHATKD